MTSRKFLVSLALLLLASLAAWADSQVRIVRLSLVDGPVQLDRDTGQGFERAIMNMPIAQGMQLWTRGDSRAEVEFEEGNTIRLAPDSKIEFSNLVLRDDGSRSTLVRVMEGRAYVEYSRKSGEDFRIEIGNQQITLDHNVHFRVDVAEGRAEVAVMNGELAAGNGVRVKKNNTIVMNLAGGGFELAKGFTPVTEDAWDKYRTDYHDKYAKSAYNGSRFYGRSDLNYYGGWMNTSFGDCWRPYGFSASWDPYSAGAWAMYPGYGYTYVSAYPWGWQPYRSGVWNYAGGGTGWCWTPNRSYYGYRNTPLYNAPSGYVPVQPPVQPPQTPLPPTHTAGGPGRHWNGGGPGLVPVGDIDPINWRAKHPGEGPWAHDGKHHRGGGEAPGVSTGIVSRGSGGATSTSTATTTAAPAARPNLGRLPDPDGNLRGGRYRNADADPARAAQREQQREQRQAMREAQRQNRGFDASSSSAPSRSSAPMQSAPVPQMSAPAPAPQMSAPVHSAPSRGETKTNVPK